jgi:predicted O-methyltransferase YrrM
MMKILNQFRSKLFSRLATKSDLNHLYRQIEGLFQIQAALVGREVHRPMRDGALSPDALTWILADLQERSSPTVVEFGSGQSTFILACYFKNRGGGRLISVEHDETFAKSLLRQLASCGLDNSVELHVLPLEETKPLSDHASCRSYPVDRLPQVEIDLALVDGPPGQENGRLTRFVPLQWALKHLSAGGAVYLDDAGRPNEHEIVGHAKRLNPSFLHLDLKAEKGLAVFKKP